MAKRPAQTTLKMLRARQSRAAKLLSSWKAGQTRKAKVQVSLAPTMKDP